MFAENELWKFFKYSTAYASFSLNAPRYQDDKFAIVGGIVGGLTYAFTGGNEEATGKIWRASMEGDYMIEPGHLTGDNPINFVGPEK